MSDLNWQHRNPEHSMNWVSKKATRALGMVVFSLALLTGILSGSGPVKAEGATISLAPTPLVLAVGGTASVDVVVGDFASAGGLGAYNLAISFDKLVVEVTSIVEGDAPFSGGTPDVGNELGGGPISRVDNEAGEVQFAAFQATQAPGPTGNIRIARINFQAVGASGATSDLTFIVASTGLVDAQSGEFVPVTPTNGSVLIEGNPGNVSGKTTLQFRASTGGRASVEISCPSLTTSTVPAEDGAWRFADVPEETCGLTATAPGYLTAEGTLTKGPTAMAVPANELLGGDANLDEFVDTTDISAVVARFGQSSVDCQVGGLVVDVTCDAFVDTTDISATVSNFGKGPQPFPSP